MLFLRPATVMPPLNILQNMKNTLLLGCILAMFFAACKQDSKGAGNQNEPENNFASPRLLAGHWVAIDFCSRADQYGSVLDAMNNAHLPYAFAISFDPNKPDSAICHNGIESWTLPVQFNDDTLELKNASQGKSVFLVYNSQGQKDITMFDATKGRAQLDRFIKSAANTLDGTAAFTTALNHNLFNGAFFAPGKNGGENIQFTPGGFILNWPLFDRYKVCYAGDCFVAGSEIDVITLYRSDKENSEQIFGFRYDETNANLEFYRLAPAGGDKSAYAVKESVYKFSRKRG
jgi:hypothetical protein